MWLAANSPHFPFIRNLTCFSLLLKSVEYGIPIFTTESPYSGRIILWLCRVHIQSPFEIEISMVCKIARSSEIMYDVCCNICNKYLCHTAIFPFLPLPSYMSDHMVLSALQLTSGVGAANNQWFPEKKELKRTKTIITYYIITWCHMLWHFVLTKWGINLRKWDLH